MNEAFRIFVVSKNKYMNEDKEIWLPVKGFEGKYEISNLARVKSLIRKDRLIKIGLTKSKSELPYNVVQLALDNKTKCMRLHRVVAMAFVPNPENKPFVNHKDGNRYNNLPENLEWVTHQENVIHAYATGLTPRGKRGKQKNPRKNKLYPIDYRPIGK